MLPFTVDLLHSSLKAWLENNSYAQVGSPTLIMRNSLYSWRGLYQEWYTTAWEHGADQESCICSNITLSFSCSISPSISISLLISQICRPLLGFLGCLFHDERGLRWSGRGHGKFYFHPPHKTIRIWAPSANVSLQETLVPQLALL